MGPSHILLVRGGGSKGSLDCPRGDSAWGSKGSSSDNSAMVEIVCDSCPKKSQIYRDLALGFENKRQKSTHWQDPTGGSTTRRGIKIRARASSSPTRGGRTVH